ncbi:MAG: biotin/lipoyl-containing protein [bacterium]
MSNWEFVIDGDVVASTLEKDGQLLRVKVGDREFTFLPLGDNLYATTVNGSRMLIAAARHRDGFYIDIDSVLLEVREVSEDVGAGGGGDSGGEKDKVFAPMPGKIVKIMVAVGDEVEVKQPLVIVEAMKMENQVNSRANGKVKAINFAAGDQVDTESPIIELELAE